MKKLIWKLVVLFGIFAACVTGFAYQLNTGLTVRKSGLAAPSLPVLGMRVEGQATNRMTGHRRPLEERTERSSVTPLPTDRSLTVLIRPYGREIASLNYQVTDLASGEICENGRVGNLVEADSMLEATFSLEKPIRSGQEYMLRFAVDLGEESPVYYYTRLTQAGSFQAEPYLNFATAFVESCLVSAGDLNIAHWLESDPATDVGGIEHLTIQSSEPRFRWLEMKPVLVRRAVPTIKEINATTASIRLDYTVRTAGEEGAGELYEVSDFLRMRQGQDEIVLLDADRRTRRVFTGVGAETNQGLNLGIQARDEVSLASTEDLKHIALSIGGDLWSYQPEERVLTRVFSFRDNSDTDARAEDRDHDIRVVRVEENGDITFAVYGHMPAGPHEGEDGLSVCRYKASEKAAEETVFLPVAKSFESLRTGLSELIYANAEDQLFFLIGERFCRVDLNSAELTVLLDEVDNENFFVSDSQRTVAWTSPMEEAQSRELTMLDLESGRRAAVNAGDRERIIGIGFFNEDVVYGLANEDHILYDESGRVRIGMSRVVVQSLDGTVQKEYTKENRLITEAVREGNTIRMELSVHNDRGLVATGEDHIINNLQREEEVHLLIADDARTAAHLELTIFGQLSGEDLTVAQAVFERAEQEDEKPTARIVEVEWPDAEGEKYNVYASGNLRGTYLRAGEAIRVAEELRGSVLDEKQRYIWERGNWPNSANANTEGLPAAVRNANLSAEVVGEDLGSGYRVLDLAGCSSESLFYQIANGRPVIAKTGENESVLLVGYDNDNFWMYQGEGNKPKAIATDDAARLFARHGNTYLTYMED